MKMEKRVESRMTNKHTQTVIHVPLVNICYIRIEPRFLSAMSLEVPHLFIEHAAHTHLSQASVDLEGRQYKTICINLAVLVSKLLARLFVECPSPCQALIMLSLLTLWACCNVVGKTIC